MKKIILLFTLAIVFASCKSTSVTPTKLDHKSQVEIKGNWSIASVTYPGSEYIKVTSFGIADSKCFVGSTWKFISNDNKGEMNVTKCSPFSSQITWFINQDGNFVMKILNAAKSRKVAEGFVLRVANQTENSFQLIDNVDVGGKMVDVVYQFTKI